MSLFESLFGPAFGEGKPALRVRIKPAELEKMLRGGTLTFNAGGQLVLVELTELARREQETKS